MAADPLPTTDMDTPAQAAGANLQLHKSLDQGVQILVGVLSNTDIMKLPRLDRLKAFDWLREQVARERAER